MGERVIFEWEGLWIKESRGARVWMGGWVRVDDRELVLLQDDCSYPSLAIYLQDL